MPAAEMLVDAKWKNANWLSASIATRGEEMLSRKSTSRDRPVAIGCNRQGAMDLRARASTVERGIRSRSLRGTILAQSSSSRSYDGTAYAFLQHCRIAKTRRKNESTGHHVGPACRPRVPSSSLSFFSHQIRDTHTAAEHRSAKSNGVNKSAKVVLAPTRSAFMIVQETSDLRLQHGGIVRFAQGRMLEEPALDVSRQIIPFEGSPQTFQDSALRVAQTAGFDLPPTDRYSEAFDMPGRRPGSRRLPALDQRTTLEKRIRIGHNAPRSKRKHKHKLSAASIRRIK